MKSTTTNNETQEKAGEISAATLPDANFDTPQPANRKRQALVLATGLAVVAGVLVLGIVPRLRAQSGLVNEAKGNDRVTVIVTKVTRSSSQPDMVLPARVRPYEEAALYARANGYLKKWFVDIGGKVDAGQVLAEIDTPDLDQELNQARGVLGQTEANLSLARTTSTRWQNLLKEHAVSQQEADEKAGAFAAREADYNAAKAAVSRLEQLTHYKEIRAPFAGIVTRRTVDTGALIQSGGNGGSNPLFQLSQVNRLRIAVDVPQNYMREVASGLPVEIRVAEFPSRVFEAKVVRTAGALEPVTRTLTTEMELENSDGALMPGIHAEARFHMTRQDAPILVPVNSVMIRSEGALVAMVSNSQTIHLVKVQLGRDFGTSVEVVSGLDDNSMVVLNPTDSLKEGTPVVANATASESPKLAKK